MATNPSEEIIRVGPLGIRFLVTGKDSLGSAAVFELTVPALGKLPAPSHSHEAWEETLYGLEGTLTWTVAGQPTELPPGAALCIPRGAVHRFDNFTDKPAKALCVITPAALGPEYFRETAALLATASPANPADPAKLVQIMLRYGLTPSRD